MARTWTLEATQTGSAGDIVHIQGVSTGTTLYFAVEDSSGNNVVYSWTPAGGFSDISGSTFNIGSVKKTVGALCFFGTDLYARIEWSVGTNYNPRVYKHTTGQSWTLQYSGTALSFSSSSPIGDLEHDGSRMTMISRYNGGIDVRSTTDGSTYAAQTANSGSFGDSLNFMIGRARDTAGSDGRVLIVDASDDIWEYDTGNDWQKVNAGSVTAGDLCGYADGKSWFGARGVTQAPKYSSDWGVTSNTASGSTITYPAVQTFGTSDYQAFAAEGGSTDVYVLSGTTWSSDGTPKSGANVKLLFVIGTTLYALVQDGNNAVIYSGGFVGPSYALTHSGVNPLGVSADGAVVAVALEDTGGDQIVVSANRTDLSTWTTLYEPGGGSAANVAPAPGNPDKLLMHGNFGTDITVVEHTISTDTNSDISPASLGAKEVNQLQVNPESEEEIMATVDTDQDLVRTADGGTTWETLNAALGFNASAFWTLWSGEHYPHRVFVAGDDGVNQDLLYSPNEGADNVDLAGSSLAATGGISGVEV